MSLTSDKVRETVLAIIEQIAPERDRFVADTNLRLVEDLGFHSLALLEMAFAIEDEFDLPPLDEETGRGIRTTDHVLDYVLGQLHDQIVD